MERFDSESDRSGGGTREQFILPATLSYHLWSGFGIELVVHGKKKFKIER